jgi:hypothetical protein
LYEAGSHPVVATLTIGGNDVVAWEVAPGTIAYLGYRCRSEPKSTTRLVR